METMTAYHVPVAMRGHANLEGLGEVPFDLDAGDLTPKDETEAALCAHLHQNGLIELASAKPKGKPAKAEPTPEKE